MLMLNKQNNIKFTIPLFSWYYIGISLVFILMRCLELIDWSPLWLLSPLWLPGVIALSVMFIVYFLKFIVFIIGIITFKKFYI